MFDINLVPEIQQKRQAAGKRNVLVTVGAAVLVGAVILSIIIMGAIKVGSSLALSGTKNKITSVQEESAKYRELENAVLSLEEGLSGVRGILDGQSNWALLLPHLEKATPRDVQFTTLKMTGNAITAKLTGKDVESVARFVNSYKSYQVVVLTGTATPQEVLTVSVGSGTGEKISAKSNGVWVYAARFDPSKNQEISVTGTKTTAKASYYTNNEEIKVTEGNLSAKVANLFTSIEAKQYNDSGQGVDFDAEITLMTEALW